MTGLRFARAARLLTGAVLAWHAGPWLAGAPPAMAGEAQKLIDDSASMLRAFVADGGVWSRFAPHFRGARAVVLAPDVIEAGFLVGGSGGQCVIVARTGDRLDWSAPSFCTLGEASVGLQFGFQKSETMMLAMTDRALRELLSGATRFGGDASLAAGLVGRGVKGETTGRLGVDFIAVSRNQGVFGGVALDGGWLSPDEDYNRVYYGRAVTARQILVDGGVTARSAEILRVALKQADGASDRYGQRHERDGEAVQVARRGDVVRTDLGPAAADPRVRR